MDGRASRFAAVKAGDQRPRGATKFAERHRPVLAAMLRGVLEAPGPIWGLRSKAGLVRLRPAPSLGFSAAVTELAIRAEELAQLTVEPRIAVIVENEISYLSVDVPADGCVIWGKGFDVDTVGRLPWLAGAQVLYWAISTPATLLFGVADGLDGKGLIQGHESTVVGGRER